MIIYTLLIGLCLFGQFFINAKNKKYYFGILVLLCAMVSAFRFQVGQDYQHWVDVYHWIENGSNVYVEFGYKLLNQFIIFIPFIGVDFLYIVTSFFIVLVFGKYIKKSIPQQYWFFSMFLFITTGIFFASMNLLRQYIAIAICLLAILRLDKKQYISYIALVFVAMTFHTSALIMLPFALFYIISKRINSNTFLWIIYILSLLFIVIDLRKIIDIFAFLLPERWKWYLDSHFFVDRNYSAILKQLVPNILVIYLIMNRTEMRKYYERFDISFALAFITTILTNCFYGILLLLRLSNYFDFSFIIIIPLIFDYLMKYEKKAKMAKIYKICIIIYYLLLTIVTIFVMNGHGVMPYKSIFIN